METKTCSVCGLEKPSNKFPIRKLQCYSCKGKIARRNESPEMRQKRLNKLAEFLEKYRRIKLASRPDKTPCSACGSLEHIRWSKGVWRCFQCQKDESKAQKKRRKAIAERRCQIAKHVKNYQAKYGDEVASKYQKWAESKHHPTVRLNRTHLIKVCLPDHLQYIAIHSVERIERMNVICGLPITNLSWKCSLCQITSDDWGFFDIDHIRPKHLKGNGYKTNLQVLCPNCHRIKCRKENHNRLLTNRNRLDTGDQIPLKTA